MRATRFKFYVTSRQLPEKILSELTIGHFLCHVKKQLPVFFVGLPQKATEFVEETCIFAARAPDNVLTGLALGQVWQLRRLFAVVKELIEWALESASHFLQRLDSRNCMAILDPGNVTPQKAGALFDIALGKFLVLTQCAEAVTDNHAGSVSYS
jgi:hypothetical protein